MFLFVAEHLFDEGIGLDPVNVIDLVIVLLVRDANFIYDNFLPSGPLGVLIMPYTRLVLVTFPFLILCSTHRTNATGRGVEALR